MLRRGEDLRGVLQDIAGEPRIDRAGVLHVVVGENSAGSQKDGEDRAQDRQADGRSKESLLNADAQVLAPEG